MAYARVLIYEVQVTAAVSCDTLAMGVAGLTR
jgi:hypothetical protein